MRIFRALATGACALFVIFFLAVGPAFSARQYFSHISLDVPEGWKAFEQGQTVAVTADDGSSSVTITIDAHDNVALKQRATNASRQLGGALPVWDGESYVFTFVNPNGLVGAVVIGDREDGNYLLVVVIGDNPGIHYISQTIEDY